MLLIRIIRKRPLGIPGGVLRNLFSLYGLYCSNYILALVSVPYLSRVLGPSSWGLVAFVQAFCGYLLVFVEFGFTFTGAREAARCRDVPDKLSRLVAEICAGKLLLIISCVAVAAVTQFGVKGFHDHSVLFWSGVFWAVIHGSSLFWYFQGLEQMRFITAFDLASKAAALLATFILVRSPADDWKVLGLQGFAGLLSGIVQVVLAYRRLSFRVPTFSGVFQAMQQSSKMFAPRNASIMYTVGNAFILGLFAPPHIVGFYSGAERISRAITGLLTPASEAVYPHLSHVASRSRESTQRLARLGIVVMGCVGIAMGIGIYEASPALVRLLLGDGYQPAVNILQVFSLLAPIIALRNVLAIHWMLPLELDSSLNLVVLGSGALNVVLALLFAPRAAGQGVAWAGVISQAGGTMALLIALRWMRLDPFSRKNRLATETMPG